MASVLLESGQKTTVAQPGVQAEEEKEEGNRRAF